MHGAGKVCVGEDYPNQLLKSMWIFQVNCFGILADMKSMHQYREKEEEKAIFIQSSQNPFPRPALVKKALLFLAWDFFGEAILWGSIGDTNGDFYGILETKISCLLQCTYLLIITGIHAIFPRPSEGHKDLLFKMTNMEEYMANLPATENPRHLPMFLLVALLLLLVPNYRTPAVIILEVRRNNTDKAFKLIRWYMWNDNLNSSDPILVRANEARLKCTTDVHFNKSPEKETVANLLGYLVPKFLWEGIRKSELQKMLHTNFHSRVFKVKEDAMVRAVTNI
ncbi:hypothetical protein PHYBLDRAFT_165258 [Phycomyces blakesleeanus NRRL 1555(-)]|uniref:Uncharacterized protein n=1 Tax=Phycomyces blakesleeanus (strain ATCC 8743b / DSM 1359 / FGSC 10004 / NBRC 33097 / NRRL 1555) TaxID=763407 RepID=A0A162UP48_PHYB8|nr:hypothetical protein PHYBLDRAFT_165258 [Phycomyces blakesleeanus NRRL 1555(-)]OAD76743.1 hypothetical protein PHYBLDRAFT_165258 [Phycomyces blakesleeanus NRRL 1555(-)]|eukprot:XP_018294783.1 hypothetical protein PHYBLDRAFT_165258 [Phycomyces blakesleeanus NRRL 1555(-)]